jgi:predicted metal-dependent phosphoesterase TrpH
MLRHDLHSHSTASDGTLTPAELVVRAAGCGVDVLALTDHDTTDGIAEAEAEAGRAGIVLIPGVEVSVTWEKRTIHVLGLGVDRRDTRLQDGLSGLRRFRDWRAAEMGRRLARHRIPDALEGARALASGPALSRTHFARFLVNGGHARSVGEAIKRWLSQGRPGHVPGQWASLEDAVGWIRGAGGVAVIAHPGRYKVSATRMRRLLAEFSACGGSGIEVISGSHSPAQVQHFTRVARDNGLYASCGSDYHGPENPWIELGRLPRMSGEVEPVWRHPRWPDRVQTAGSAA